MNPVISEAVAEINLPGASNDHRELYKLIINSHYGVTRKALKDFLAVGDRSARNLLAETSMLAALNAHETRGKLVVGHDSATGTYRAASNWSDALRILTPTLSRIETLLQEATAQYAAAVESFGPDPRAAAVQTRLFTAEKRMAALR